MREWARDGRVRFGHFYFRRFLRLTPALALIVAVVALASILLQNPFGAAADHGAHRHRRHAAVGQLRHRRTRPATTSPTTRRRTRCCTPGRCRSRSSSTSCSPPCWSSPGCSLRRGRRRAPVVIVAAIALGSFALARRMVVRLDVGPRAHRLLRRTRVLRLLLLPHPRLGVRGRCPAGPRPGADPGAHRRLAAPAGRRGRRGPARRLRLRHQRRPAVPGRRRPAARHRHRPAHPRRARTTPPGSARPSRRGRWSGSGDTSYSWYLWHWPLIVFTALLFPHRPGLLVAAAAVSLLPAAGVVPVARAAAARLPPALASAGRRADRARPWPCPLAACVVLLAGRQRRLGTRAAAPPVLRQSSRARPGWTPRRVTQPPAGADADGGDAGGDAEGDGEVAGRRGRQPALPARRRARRAASTPTSSPTAAGSGPRTRAGPCCSRATRRPTPSPTASSPPPSGSASTPSPRATPAARSWARESSGVHNYPCRTLAGVDRRVRPRRASRRRRHRQPIGRLRAPGRRLAHRRARRRRPRRLDGRGRRPLPSGARARGRAALRGRHPRDHHGRGAGDERLHRPDVAAVERVRLAGLRDRPRRGGGVPAPRPRGRAGAGRRGTPASPSTTRFPALCPDGVCSTERDGSPVYQDETHLAVPGSLLLADGLEQVLSRAAPGASRNLDDPVVGLLLGDRDAHALARERRAR